LRNLIFKGKANRIGADYRQAHSDEYHFAIYLFCL